METQTKAEHAREQLQKISELEQGWGYFIDQNSEPFKKEFVNYCSDILESIIDTFGNDKAPEIFPIVGGTCIQMEYETDELGYLEFVIYEDKHMESLYVKTMEDLKYDKYNDVLYYSNIEGVILDCINKYFGKNLYNNYMIINDMEEKA